ncbi:hypothetical protein CIPAW_09G107600 [Carya illinoinensis]|uniref:Uncharacterized protein n=2 Tax=Carya illinoinensis TaxID=32201 RepID=A0A8T1PLH6_CARIL|nr:hypothetical protein CIPAW_09G107600 [Carya illinoinensis]KAG6641923.1 hypothetical protein CIPAW_09G107600 [Carya illinoinensis]KAG6695580.1 hypothetical protein I3842_09G105000 [Carya illinoinensis]
MDIQEKLMQHRSNVAMTFIVSVVISLLLYASPRLINILTYFWPLFASTAVLLVAIIGFGGLSQLASETHGYKAGEGIIDYVQRRPEHTEVS